MNTHAEGLHFPFASGEALWEWHVPSDRLVLSAGALQAFRLPHPPVTMGDFLKRVPTGFLSTLAESRRKVLETPNENFLESSYPFEGLLVRERLLVLDRDDGGRPVRVLGQCSVAGESPMPTERTGTLPGGAGFWTCDVRGHCTRMDGRCAALLGFSPEARVMDLSDWQSRLRDGDGMLCRHKKLIAGTETGDVFEDLIQIRRESGDYALMDLRGSVLERDADGRAVTLGGSLRSALDFSSSNEPDNRESGRLLLAVNATGDGLWDWDATTDRVYYSPRYLSMLGYTAEDFPARFDVWEAKIHPDDYAKIVPMQRALVETPEMGDSFECTYRMRKADGAWAWIMGRGYVTHRDADGRATRLVGLHTDISASQGERERLEELVKNDALTGLHSRAFCDLEVENMERARVRPVSVISCDVNGLKLINDYLGHNAGDDLLRRTAVLLREHLRLTDCAARMGGDEFVLLLPGCGSSKARDILERIRRGLEAANERGYMPVLLSFGLASTDDPAVPVSQLLRDADRAMLRDKNAHRPESHRHIKKWIERDKNVIVSLEDSRYEG